MMSLHLFGAILTPEGVAANNRGESDGNITTLQKLLWKGQVHTTVSSEAIRWAIRYLWQKKNIPVNRVWDDAQEDFAWNDTVRAVWNPEYEEKGVLASYIDDDVMGFMIAEGAKVDASDVEEEAEVGKKAVNKSKKKSKGTCTKRRGVLEISRAISLSPFAGDISFNAKSGVKGKTSLYGTEMHATRFQYGFSLTPERLHVTRRVFDTLDAIVSLGEVAGNHSRFLYDFAPDSVIYRITEDPAPRLLYVFELERSGVIRVPDLLRRIEAGDVAPAELFVGGPVAKTLEKYGASGMNVFSGVKEANTALKKALGNVLDIEATDP